jgi:hypothetical protein
MAASINDLITAVMNGGAPVPTTVSSIRTPGATTLSVIALTHWPVVSGVHFVTGTPMTDAEGNAVINPTSLALWKAIVSGTTLVNLTLEASATGADPGNSVNDIVQMAPDSAWAQDLFTALTLEHNTLGNHTQAMTINGDNVWNILTQEWVPSNESWAFASASTITVPSNATLKYQIGDILQLTQSATVKYFTVIGVTATVLTVSPLLGVTLANSAITANSYAHTTPFGAPAGAAFNPYKFSTVIPSQSFSATGFTAAKIAITNTPIFDTGNNFSTANSRFVAPVAGYYFFFAQADWFVVNGVQMRVMLYKNGSFFRYGNQAANNTGVNFNVMVVVASLMFLNAGDYVEVWGGQSSGSSVSVSDGYFDGYLVSQT